MALKEEPYALPLKLVGQAFARATPCGANSCVLASYTETPSIAWISTSPLVVDGAICVLPKFTGWSQKSPLRAEWPFAVSIWKRPGTAKSFALFIYHLAEASYYVFKISAEAQAALMMGYERAAVVQKDCILIYNLFDPTRPPTSISAEIKPQLLPALCSASSDELILTSYNTIQQWVVNPKTAQAKLMFQSHAEGFGFCEMVAYDTTIAAISEGGHKLHLYDTYGSDPADARPDEGEIAINSPIPITKLYMDEEFVITGLADGTMKLYDRELRTFLAQLNVIPVAARGLDPASGGTSGAAAPAYLQHKISFLARHDELVIASMLDPTHKTESGGSAQLEISIWPLRGQNAVQPLKTKLLPGAVNFVHYEERNMYLLALTQHALEPESPKFAPPTSGALAMANRGPLVLLTWHPPFKSLMASGLKWQETNSQQQAKLAAEVMEKVLLEPSFFRAMFLVEADAEEIEQVVESMFICLTGKDALQTTFIETAISQEVLLRRHSKAPSTASVSSPSLSHSTPEDSITRTPPAKKASSAMSLSASNVPKDLADRNGSSTTSATPPQYFPANAMTTAVITKCLDEVSHAYTHTVLAKPVAALVKTEMLFTLPSTHATSEEQPMINLLMRSTSQIIDGLIENQSKFSPMLQKMLSTIHHAVCADNPTDSELRSFRRGAARVFLDYVVLRPWLYPVEAGLLHKVNDETRHNLRVVAQLMQVIAGYSKHKLIDPSLCSLVTEYSTKWRSWLLSKVAERHDSDTSSPMTAGKHGKDKDKDKRKNMARGISFVAQKGGNSKTGSLVVTKFIITHASDLLAIMTRGGHRSPDPAATKIRAISESLLMPIMSMMAKRGTKNTQLAASLRVFGRSGSMPSGSTNSSGSSHNSSSESVSSESVEKDGSEKVKEGGPSREVSPMKKAKKKRKNSTASPHSSIDSGSSEGKAMSVGHDSASSTSQLSTEVKSADGSLPAIARRSPRAPTKHKTRAINKKISSGSLTSSSVEEERLEDMSDQEEDGLPPRAQSVETIRIVGEVVEMTVGTPNAPHSPNLSASSIEVGSTPTRRKRKVARPSALPTIPDQPHS